jgi:hypothetical protein
MRALLTAKKDERCEDTTINKNIDETELVLGLLDAPFMYLNFCSPNDLKKSRPLKL